MPRMRGAKEGADAGLDWLIMLPAKRHGSKVLFLKAIEYCLYLGVPMPGALTEAVQGTFEEPIFILLSIGIANWRFDNRDFVVGEDALAEGILIVTLLECMPSFDSHADN
jgi:hypothetical protein